MGRFPICSRSGKLYLMLACQFEYKVIMVEPFLSKHDHHRLADYNNIRRHIKQCGYDVNLQILDNEASA